MRVDGSDESESSSTLRGPALKGPVQPRAGCASPQGSGLHSYQLAVIESLGT